MELIFWDQRGLVLDPVCEQDQPVLKRVRTWEEGNETDGGQLTDLHDAAAAADVQVGHEVGNLEERAKYTNEN